MKKLFFYFILLFSVVQLSCKKSTIDIDNGFPGKGEDGKSITADISEDKVDVSRFNEAKVFPGLVCSEEPRITTTLMMDLFYNPVNEGLRISVPPAPQFSTGLYAAPGERISIEVPADEQSLNVQVGAWRDDLSSNIAKGQTVARAPMIILRQKLQPGTNYIRNLYGGHIYIYSEMPKVQTVKLTFSKVCKSPDFILGQTDEAKWKEEIRNSCVPFLELRSKNLIAVVPRDYFIQYPPPNIAEALNEWDEGIKRDYYEWMGLSENAADPIDRAPLLPMRIVLDINPSAGSAHSGFPVVATMNKYWFSTLVNTNYLRNADVWGVYHEFGHNCQQHNYWSWSTLGESTCNLFSFKLANRMRDNGYPDAWVPSERDWVNERFPPALAFAKDPNLSKNFNGSDERINSPFMRMVPFIQILDKIPANWGYLGQPNGWYFMPYLYSKARRALRQPGSDLNKQSFVYEAISDFTKKDWQLFFRNWGIPVNNISKAAIAAKDYPLMTQKIWEYDPGMSTGGDDFVTIDPYARSNWIIHAVSSEQASDPASNILDGNSNTGYHPQWSPNINATMPQWIVIDFNTLYGQNEALKINGLKFTQVNREKRRVRRVHVSVSNDAITWTPLPDSPFELDINSTLEQTVPLVPSVATRYVKLLFASMSDITATDGPWACLSEFDVVKP